MDRTGQVKVAIANDLEVMVNMVYLLRLDVAEPARILKYLDVLDGKIRSLSQLLTLEMASNPPN